MQRTESEYSREEPNIQAQKRKYKKLTQKSKALQLQIDKIKQEITQQRSKCLQSVSEINRIAGERLVIDEKIVIKPEFILQKNDKPKQFLHFLVKNYADMEAEQKALQNHYAMVEQLIASMQERLNQLNQRVQKEKAAYNQENADLSQQFIVMKEKYQNQIAQNQSIRNKIKQTKTEIIQKNQEIDKLKSQIQSLKPGYSKIKNSLLSRKQQQQQKRQEYSKLYQDLRRKADEQEKQLRKYQQRIDYLQKFKEEAQIQLSEIGQKDQSFLSDRKKKKK